MEQAVCIKNSLELTDMAVLPPPNPINDSKSKDKLKIYGVIVIALLVALAGSTILSGALVPPSQKTLLNDSFFKGAYASYYGETTVYSQKLGLELRLGIVDVNSTHFKALSYVKINSSAAGTVYEQQYNNWTAITYGSVDYSVDGAILLSKNNDSVYFPNLGTRDCTILEYMYKSGSGINGNVTVYLEPITGWAYKISYSLKISGTNVNIDLPIESTNVPVLK